MKKIRYLLGIILISVAIFIVYPKFKDSIEEIPGLLHDANKFLIVFLVLFQLATYLADALLSKILLKIAGFGVRLRDTLKISVLDTLANLTLPLLGSPMIKYHFYKKLKVSSPAILFLITSWTMFFYLTAIIFFVISVFFIPQNSGLIPINFLFFGLALILAILYVLAKKGNKLFFSGLEIAIKIANKFSAKFLKKEITSRQKLQSFTLNLKQIFSELKAGKRDFFFAITASLLFYLSDILTVYFAFWVFGYTPSIFLVIFGFTISFILSFLTSIPYIPGIVESSFAVVFVKLGFPANVSILAALLFRLFSYWLPMPFGLASYLTLKREAKKEQGKEIQ